MADTEQVIVAGKPVKDDTKAEPQPNTLGSGKPSAASKTPAGDSKGLDTKDETAKAWVKSGAKADASTKGFDAPSSEELREDSTEVDRDMAKANIANMADGNSNHNTAAGVNPIAVAQMDRPDYNPQRRPSSRANMQSTVGEHPEPMAKRVDAKKVAPTNAEIVTDRRNEANSERDRPLADYTSPFLGEQ